METPAILQVCTTQMCGITIYEDERCPITATSPRIISLRFISKKFPRLLAEREIIANAFYSPDLSPNRGQRYNYYLYFDVLLRKKCEKSWKITEKRQSMDLTVVEKKVKGNRGKG